MLKNKIMYIGCKTYVKRTVILGIGCSLDSHWHVQLGQILSTYDAFKLLQER